MAPKNPEILHPKLEEAQKALETALDEACAEDVRDADTEELIRLDESLALASQAAKEVISVRRRLEEQPSTRESHREFEDGDGVRWDAFAVYPSSATAQRSSLPDPYRRGWLAFASAEETRRLAPIPDGWKELSADALRRLWERAEPAPRRTAKDSDDNRLKR